MGALTGTRPCDCGHVPLVRAPSRVRTRTPASARVGTRASPQEGGLLIKTTWGADGFETSQGWESFLGRVKSEGWNGIEAAYSFVPGDRRELVERCRDAGLLVVMQVHTAGYTFPYGGVGSQDPKVHLESFRTALADCTALGVDHVNVHSGHDAWDEGTAVAYLKEALTVQADFDVPVSHETHRRRLFWNPWQAAALLSAVDDPELQLTADLSHWVVCAERIFQEESDPEWPAILDAVAERTSLIHARVGYAEGPQVPDPSDPAYALEVEAHTGWWQAIVARMKQRGLRPMLEPEYGPPPYMQTAPGTGAPAADLWAVTEGERARLAAALRGW